MKLTRTIDEIYCNISYIMHIQSTYCTTILLSSHFPLLLPQASLKRKHDSCSYISDVPSYSKETSRMPFGPWETVDSPWKSSIQWLAKSSAYCCDNLGQRSHWCMSARHL